MLLVLLLLSDKNTAQLAYGYCCCRRQFFTSISFPFSWWLALIKFLVVLSCATLFSLFQNAKNGCWWKYVFACIYSSEFKSKSLARFWFSWLVMMGHKLPALNCVLKEFLLYWKKQTAMILEEIEILLLDIITSSERLCNDVLLCTSTC